METKPHPQYITLSGHNVHRNNHNTQQSQVTTCCGNKITSTVHHDYWSQSTQKQSQHAAQVTTCCGNKITTRSTGNNVLWKQNHLHSTSRLLVTKYTETITTRCSHRQQRVVETKSHPQYRSQSTQKQSQHAAVTGNNVLWKQNHIHSTGHKVHRNNHNTQQSHLTTYAVVCLEIKRVQKQS